MDSPETELPAEYRAAIADVRRYGRPSPASTPAVVIVTYGRDRATFRPVLRALDAQTRSDFELTIVDNGTEWDVASEIARSGVVDRYVSMARNVGVATGRNVGARLANGDLLVFLDDDGVPRRDFVEQHCRVHEGDVVAARGRVVPQRNNIYNEMQQHYDLGEDVRPCLLNIEGNTSIDRETFLDVGGFNDRLEGRAGHEGVELTYRLLHAGVASDQIVYFPDAVIEHDYAVGLRDYLEKQVGRRRARRYLARHHRPIFELNDRYQAQYRDADVTTADRLKSAPFVVLATAADVVFNRLLGAADAES